MQGARWSSHEAYLRTSKQRGHRSNAAVGEFLRRHLLLILQCMQEHYRGKKPRTRLQLKPSGRGEKYGQF
jgi:hypothetical protein